MALEFRSQTNFPQFPTTTELGIYEPNGLLPGTVAITLTPFSLWIYSLTPPTSDVAYIPAIAFLGGYWIRYADEATDIPYTDTAPLLGSTDVQGAIDALKLSDIAESAANLAALPAAPANGDMVFVRSVLDLYAFDTGSALTPDGITVVAGTGGNWMRRSGLGHPKWRKQSAWTINATTGNDENAGGGGAPLKTIAELERRWGTVTGQRLNQGGGVASPIVVTIASDLPNEDAIHCPLTTVDTHVQFVGGIASTSRSGTITAVTALNRATNVPWSIEDTGIANWTADVGKRVRITSGANAGAVAYVAKDIGGNAARVSQFWTSASAFPIIPTQKTPAVADPYSIEQLFIVSIGTLIGDSYGRNVVTNTNTNVYFYDLEIRESNTNTRTIIDTSSVITLGFIRCIFQAVVDVYKHQGFIIGCKFSKGMNARPGSQSVIYSSLFGVPASGTPQGFIGFGGSSSLLDGDTLFQACSLKARSAFNGAIGLVGVFDVVSNFANLGGHGVTVGHSSSSAGFTGGCTLLSATIGLGAHQLYGAANAGAGLFVAPGCSFSYVSTVPVIAGALGDFKLGAATSARAFDDSTGAYTALLIANTWANVPVAVPAGFGGNAHDPVSNAHILVSP